ncbi:MAG: NAD(P)/FAD-dependent oxidoreductase [Microcystaceae cyanobacterium]
MQQFDVVIIGAGPAGGQCSRLLSELGYCVLLVEQLENFQQHNFSSAASPLETLDLFKIDPNTVAAYWQKIEIVSTNVYRSWSADKPLGVIFDFAKLRQFLAEDTLTNGGEVWLSHRYLNYEQTADQTLVTLQKRKGEKVTIATKVLVDATGYTRAVIYPNKKEKPTFSKGIGIEYLIKVEPDIYQKYADSLLFFLGYQWSPKGYSWIFPMDDHCLKVGSAFIEGNHKIITELKPLRYYLEQIIENYIKIEQYQLIESHGSILDYSSGLNDIYYQDNVIAIGDAVSTVNWLGGEGIRHGMQGAEIAAKYIHQYLEGKINDFSAYQAESKARFATRWNQCDAISQKVYLEYSDQRIDQGVNYLKYLNTQDMMDILFYYQLEKASKGLKQYFAKKLDNFKQWLFSLLNNVLK